MEVDKHREICTRDRARHGHMERVQTPSGGPVISNVAALLTPHEMPPGPW